MSPKTGPFKNRVPKQIVRALPLYVVGLLVIGFLFQLGTHGPSTKLGDMLKREVSYQTPIFTEGSKFPKKIWQSWKVDPLNMDERDSTSARTWTLKNPTHRYEVLTDNTDLDYVETNFGPNGLNRPDIVYMYRSLTARIIKADLLRYLVMYLEGGVYTDIDVEALKPIDRFIPERFQERDIDMIVGVEIDQPQFEDHPILGKKSKSFCQWTFMCKPRLPVMMHLIDNIIMWLNDVAKKQKCAISDIVLDFDEVISGTGPSAFTIAILKEMSKREGKTITWNAFHELRESNLIGGVLVLTVEAFAAGQGHSDSGNHGGRQALVKHHYHASGWPSKHPRYSHPVYAEVEKCNWDEECVKQWDFDIASWSTLSTEEQDQRIADKEAADLQAAQLDALAPF